MIEVRKTAQFVTWLDGLRDFRVRARIQARIKRLSDGNPGDVRSVGEGVSELKIDYGPGYRVLLCGTWERTDRPARRRRQKNTITRYQNSVATRARSIKWGKRSQRNTTSQNT